MGITPTEILVTGREELTEICGNRSILTGPILTFYNTGNAVAVNSKLIIKYTKPNLYSDNQIIAEDRSYHDKTTKEAIPLLNLEKRSVSIFFDPKRINRTGSLYGYPASLFEYHLDLADIQPGELIKVQPLFLIDTEKECGMEEEITFQIVEEGFSTKSKIRKTQIIVRSM